MGGELVGSLGFGNWLACWLWFVRVFVFVVGFLGDLFGRVFEATGPRVFGHCLHYLMIDWIVRVFERLKKSISN